MVFLHQKCPKQINYLKFLMEKLKAFSGYLSLTIVIIVVLIFSVINGVKGQVSTPCSSSMISSFTPCLNYITGSSSGRTSPAEDCCNALKSLAGGSKDCACLLITGGVPFTLPLNRTLAISLPQMCNGGIPIQCKASGAPLPPPGPVLFGPAPAPTASSPSSPRSRASKATNAAPPPEEATPAPSPVTQIAPTAHPGIKPVVNPKSASNPSCVISPSILLLVIGIVVFY